MNRLFGRCVIAAVTLALLAQGRTLAQSAPTSGTALPPPSIGASNWPSSMATPGTSTFVTSDGMRDWTAPTSTVPAASKPYTPVMLGDFTGPIGTLFLDLKIAEGQSPRPMDRIYYNFNGYSNVNKNAWTDPTQPIREVNLYRSVIGLEKTFFDGQVSLGVRVPFYTLDIQTKDIYLQPTLQGLVPTPGGPGSNTTEFGNISAIVKAILWEDKATGNLLSGGATISIPTASSRLIDPGQGTIMYMQPFGGFIMNQGNLFTQGFVSVIIPIARPESTVLFTGLSVGYWLYHDTNPLRLVTGIAPMAEVHVTTPLRQADPSIALFGIFDTLRIQNTVTFTLGATFELSGRATLGLGVAVPVTGLKPFDYEGIAQLNWRF